MKKQGISLLGSPRALGFHQELAAAVIRRALLDATDANAPERVRAGARVFLADSPMLRQWCSVAGIDPGLVRERCLKQDSSEFTSRGIEPRRERAAARL